MCGHGAGLNKSGNPLEAEPSPQISTLQLQEKRPKGSQVCWKSFAALPLRDYSQVSRHFTEFTLSDME